jgi:hypothetical protein
MRVFSNVKYNLWPILNVIFDGKTNCKLNVLIETLEKV